VPIADVDQNAQRVSPLLYVGLGMVGLGLALLVARRLRA
jgi:hypothetical protein